jgi:hypothetical protein
MSKAPGQAPDKSLPDPFTRGLRRVLMALLALAMLAFLFIVVRARMNGEWPLAFARPPAVQSPTITTTLSLTPSPSDTLTPSPSPTQPVQLAAQTQTDGASTSSPAPQFPSPPTPRLLNLY